MHLEMPIKWKVTVSTYYRTEFIRAAREANEKFGEEAVASMHFLDDEDHQNAMFTFEVSRVHRLTQILAFISLQKEIYDVGIYGNGEIPGHAISFSFGSEIDPSASLRINFNESDNARVKTIEKAISILHGALNLSCESESGGVVAQ